MELVKNIFFNTDKLIEKTNVKISYTGKLFQDNNNEIYLHYGFGENWTNVNEIKMIKTDLGFQSEIELTSDDTLNLCFRTSDNVWDNNDEENYVFPIEKQELSLVIQEENSILNTKGLRKTYIWSKKIKLAVYKVITYLPKIVSGNYKRKVNIEE